MGLHFFHWYITYHASTYLYHILLGARLSSNLVPVERRKNFFFQLSIHILSFQMCIPEDEWKVWIGPCFPTRQPGRAKLRFAMEGLFMALRAAW